MKRMLVWTMAGMLAVGAGAQTGRELPFQKWALTPPMGWNSWDCYGPTVVEDEVKANTDYMAEKLAVYGWEYVVVDIRWFVENDKAGGYNQTNPIYVYDEWGRYTPALNRFPSAANGVGFRALADYVHGKGLKFGIHLMRGLPKIAAEKKLPVKGTNGITCDMIASNDSACTWLRDNYKVDYRKPGAQEYYNSCFELYAEWGVDFVKIDDLSRPYHTAEIEMIRKAIDHCGRPIVLSISPGETPLEKVDHVKTHANMWRTVDDFWDNWSQLNYQFQVCAKWAPYIAPGTWPDADMLPLGKISIRGERGEERWTNFTRDEQYTMMNLWTIFKSPLMFGGDLPQNDKATDSLLTNRDVLYMHHYSANNRQLSKRDNHIVWAADDPANGDKFVALFNTGGSEFVNTKDALYRSGTISYLTTGYAKDADVDLTGMKTGQLALVVSDDGDGYDSDHADWIDPVVTLADGSTIKLTDRKYLRGTCGWGSIGVNRNLEGNSLSINGQKYDNGYAVHANSILLFDIPENAVRFTALVGLDNSGTDQGSKSSVEFMVFDGDPTMREETTDQWSGGNVTIKIDPGKQAACSGFISRTTAQTRDMEADIEGAEKLYLVVTNGGDGLSYDHADWANPVLVDKDGKEFSLTEIAWEANPVNGWNAPKVNKNNEGNTITMGGQAYDKGFGVNAPSMLTFVLPEGHGYVKFKATVGYDDDVKDAAEGVTMEFRVFTEDPAPGEASPVALDLVQLGFAADQPCRVKEMWKGKDVGTFKNAEFAPILRSHASGLYRVSAVERTEGASVAVEVPSGELTAGEPFEVKITVSGGPSEGAYVQLLCGGEIIGTLPVEADGTARYTATLYGGTYMLQAKYSGTTAVASAVSDECPVTVGGASEDLTHLQQRLQSLSPAYVIAKDIIHLLLTLQDLIKDDPEVAPYMKLVMVENYNVSAAEKLFPACDISEQISLASKEASGTGNMKFMLNGAVTLGTMDGANVEISELVGEDNIYIFGESSEKVIEHYEKADYCSRDIYENDKRIKECVDFIVSEKMLALGHKENLERLHHELVSKDWFMTLLDFNDYVEKKDQALADYADRKPWAKKMLVNIAKAGFFSSDRTIEQYNNDIWHLTPAK